MKTLNQFSYHAPDSLSEATELLVRYRESSKVFAGGTDVMVLMKDRVITPEHVIDIKSIPDMQGISGDENEGLRIGSLTKITAIMESPVIRTHYPALSKAAGVLGSPQVRNKATIGGNVCRSSPSADTIPALMVYQAALKLAGPDGERIVPIEEFFTGPGRNVLENEILTEIDLPAVAPSSASAFQKISRVSEDLSKVNCAVNLRMEGSVCKDIKIVLGAVAATPVRARNVERALEGRELTATIIEHAAKKVSKDISPIDDVRSTAAYRQRVGRIMVRNLVIKAWKGCQEN